MSGHTRAMVLQPSGTDAQRDASCQAAPGRRASAYGGLAVTDAKRLDIDRMASPATAWRAGAGSWTAEKHRKFANDVVRPQIPTVSATTHWGNAGGL